MYTRTLIGLCLVLSSAAVSARPGHGFPPDYDLNGDGRITPEEVQQARAAEFPKIDTDSSGTLSVAEMQAWLEQKQTERFNSLDADQNGALSQEEFVSAKPERAAGVAARTFKLLDTDKGGSLSVAEFKAFRPINTEIIRLFSHLDTDDDGLIAQAEYLAAPTHRGHHHGGFGWGGHGR